MEVDFLILGMLNYYGLFLGIFKNVFDYFNMDYFKMKFVGFICNSGGIVSFELLLYLRVIVCSLFGIVVLM